MLDVADVILTLMTLEITSLKNVRVFMEIAEKLGYDDQKVQLVANRNDSSGGIKASDVEASLARKIPHTIVSDGRALVLAVNRGVPFVISHRDSQVAKDIFTLAERLSGAGEGAGAQAATPQKAAPKQGLRLFGAR
jgi:pilus assembly protein CpaE